MPVPSKDQDGDHVSDKAKDNHDQTEHAVDDEGPGGGEVPCKSLAQATILAQRRVIAHVGRHGFRFLTHRGRGGISEVDTGRK